VTNTAAASDPEAPQIAWRARLWAFYKRQKHRVDGCIIGAAGIAILVWTDILSSSITSPPSRPELGILLASAAVLQVWAGTTFGKIGRVDAEKAKSAVRRLYALGLSTQALRTELRSSIHSDDPTRHRDSVIRADEGLSNLQIHLSDAISDWTDVHEEALEATIEGLRNQQRIAE
jgi:hypothetical protein